ncbi:MAG: glycosyltransferase family 39 protein, partial [Lachnospiraceae bacterium]|nr:glycosyltransferase family 39 protein [Lachnospiraceae bacterium]
AQVQPIDELYYNEIAVKIYKYGLSGVINGTWSSTSVANAKTFLIPNLLTAFSLKIFGNNFWGLKVPYVLMGYCSGILIYILIRHIVPGKKWIHLLIMISYVLDFNIFMLSRDAVTVMPCMLACLITVIGVFKISHVSRKWLFLGFWSVVSFCLVYMGLPFIAVVTGVLLIISVFSFAENRIRKIVMYFIGITLGVVTSEIASRVFFQQHIIKTIKDTMVAHKGKIGGLPLFKNIGKLIVNFGAYWLSNVFRYNYILLLFGIISMIVLLIVTVTKKDKIACILLTFIGAHWVQTIFLNNMTASKAAITYPILLLGVGYVVSAYYEEFILEKGIKREISLVMIGVFTVGAIWIEYGATAGTKTSFRYAILFISLVTALIVCICILFGKKKIVIIPWVMTLGIMCSMSFYYALYNPTYSDRELMKDLGRETSDGMVISGVGFNLYNLCESPANIYDYYKGEGCDENTMYQSMIDACYEYDDLYYIGYALGDVRTVDILNELLKDTPYEFVGVKVYPREYERVESGSHDSDMVLCKKVLREE